MKQSESEYTAIKIHASDEELEKYRTCFQKNGTQRDISNLKWLHQQNLLKEDMIYYAVKQNQLAAIYTALPVKVRINGQVKKALQSIDTLTDENHRGKGLFIKLANMLYNEAPEFGYSFVFGFPNANSAPGFFNKLKWVSFGEAPFLVKPFNIFYFLKKFINRNKRNVYKTSNHVFNYPELIRINNQVQIKQITRFEDDYNTIWNSAAKNIKICVERDADYMNWRYIDKPGENYCCYGLYKSGVLQGVIVFAIKAKHDGLLGYIMDVVFLPEDTWTAKKLLKFANNTFRQENVDAALAWSIPGAFNYNCYKKRGYFWLPEKLRPQKLFLGARGFIMQDKDAVEDKANWYISYSDSDTV